MNPLFEPYEFGPITLKNRIVMAPMTRSRRPDLIAGPDTAEYYRQRSSAGLIITEGTHISPQGRGNADVPGMWTDEQRNGWGDVADAVHAEGSHIVAQIWHQGRASHTLLQEGKAPVGPSNQTAETLAWVRFPDGTSGPAEASPPRALRTDEVPGIVADFAAAAARSIKAGLDGVELHGAHGYLLDQFLNSIVNDRTDDYGGSIEARARLMIDALEAVIARIGADKVGIRISPFGDANGAPTDPEAGEMLDYLAGQFERLGLVFVHFNDTFPGRKPAVTDEFLARFRSTYTGTVIQAGAMTLENAERRVAASLIDLPAFGQPFISNPDLVERLRNGWPLAAPERETYYGGGAAGYTDYPRYAA